MLSARLRRAVAFAGVVGVAVGGQAGAGSSSGSHVIQRGETLSGVARSVGVSVADLAQANGISDIHRIYAGRRLVVPSGSGEATLAAARPDAVVARGQTLSGLARSLGVSVSDLARANGISDVHFIRAGRRLVVPVGTAGAVASPASAAPPAGARGAVLPDRLRQLPERLALMPHFDAAASEFGVPADLLKAMTWLESGWQNDRVSSTRAFGIGQLMPDTVDFLNGILLDAPLDPRRADHNIRMSARFLAYLLRQNDGDVPRALSSYYQGLASVRRRGPLPETERYVANVLALREKF